MKILMQVIFVISLTLATDFLDLFVIPLPKISQLLAQVNHSQSESKLITLSLPKLAEVILKDASPSKSGQLTVIDYQRQQIKIESGDQAIMIDINKIKKIRFQGEIVLRDTHNDFLRQPQPLSEQIWREPLTNFNLRDPQTGQVQIQLSSVTQTDVTNSCSEVGYLINEMEFESPTMMTIKVLSYCLSKD